MDFAIFLGLSIVIIIIPGPNVLVIVATSLQQGRTRGLQTVAGTSVAMIVQMLIAAAGTHWLVQSLSNGFSWIKWGGVAYLLYLGIQNLLRSKPDSPKVGSAMGSFGKGFVISLTNPKTILFFSAFLPQFVDPGAPYLGQIIILSAQFWILAVLLDTGYALLASRLANWAKTLEVSSEPARISGLAYIGAGALLASSGQST